jgi:putative transcriptional regulator
MTNRLKDLRTQRKWTQAHLAKQLEVSRQTVNALERGKYHPSLRLAFRIARLFQSRIEDVFQPPAGRIDAA